MPEELSPSTVKNSPENRPITVQKILRYCAIVGFWLLSVAIVASLLANDQVGPLPLIGLIADVFGFTTGALGIYAYYKADELNNEVGKQTQAMKSSVDELNKRIWNVLEQKIINNESDLKKILETARMLDTWRRAPSDAFTSHEKVESRIQTQNIDASELDEIKRLRVFVNLGLMSKDRYISFLQSLLRNKKMTLEALLKLAPLLDLEVEIQEDSTVRINIIEGGLKID